MSNRTSNFPTAQATRILNESGDFTSKTINSLMELSAKGKPKDITELNQRIKEYFSFCSEKNFKPGVESLSLSLGISRNTFWCWCNGVGVDEEWSNSCQVAKQSIISFVEAAATSGKLNPAISIFILKNIANYKDQISFEEVNPQPADKDRILKAALLPKLDIAAINAENNEGM